MAVSTGRERVSRVVGPRTRLRRRLLAPRPHRRLVPTPRGNSTLLALPRWMYRGYQQASAGDAAAAIAFNGMVALAPMLLFLVSIASLVLQSDRVLVDTVHTAFWALNSSQAHDALDAILKVRRNSGWLWAISLVSFAWIGTNFVSSLARGMNRVYGVPNRRFVHQRLRDFIVVVLIAILFILAAIAAIAPTFFVGREVGVFFQQWSLALGRFQILSYAISVVASMALFVVLYRLLPNAGQQLRDVWPGSLTAAVLFVLMAQVFPIYIRLVGGANRYGQAFAVVTLLVAWFYVLAHVLLFGTYINATYQLNCRQKRRIGGRSLPGCN